MRHQGDTVLKAFLSRCSPDKARELERFLPEAERLRLEKMPPPAAEINVEVFTQEGMLEKVHWSWFLPTLKTYPDLEQKLFLAALSPNAAKNLARILHFSTYMQEISEVARRFLRGLLIQSLLGPDDRLLPVDCLPISPLTPLLHLSKNELIRIIDLLSMYDLATDLRQIVETKMLRKIYSFLSEEEQRLVKKGMAQQEPFIPPGPRVGLERWDGSEEALRHLFHRKGLARLAAALSGQDPDFIWHLCHQLDIGRGTALFKLCGKEPIPHISDAIIRQIEELL